MHFIIKTLRLATLFVVSVFIATNSQAQSFLTNGLVAYYPLNGNANDASGNGYNATSFNVAWGTNRFGFVSSSGQFDGISSFAMLPSTLVNLMSGTNPMSISTWVTAPPSVTNGLNNAIIEIGGSTSHEGTGMFGMAEQSGHYGVPPGMFFYSEFGSTYDVYSDTPICDNSWHQCVALFDGTNLSLYVDGVFKSTRAIVSNRLNTRGTIGIRVDLAGEYWNGGISDIRIYNRALLSNEVQNLYQYETGRSPQLTIATLVLQLSTTNLWVGGSYQIQTSTDLLNWTNYGTPFIATSATAPQYVSITSSKSFFRILVAP